MEIWKTLKINNKYLISNKGRVKSLCYRNSNKEKILSCYGKNYKIVKLTKNNERKDYYIHRLVAEAFIDNPNNYPCINHINGDKRDNRVENLEWCTYQHNIKEAFKLGLSKNKRGSGNGRSVEVNQYTLENKFIRKWESMRLAETTLKIKHINECCKNKRKTAGGYIWRLAKQDEQMLKGLEIQ